MQPERVIEELLSLPDQAARRGAFVERTALLDGELARALKAQADQLLRSDIQGSLERADLLLEMGELTGNQLHRALGLLARANAYVIGLGRYHESLLLCDQAAAIYEAHGRPVEWARAQANKVSSLTLLGRHAEAGEIAQRASQVLEEHQQWLPLAMLTANLGVHHGRMGDDAGALELFDRALGIYQRLGPEGELYFSHIEQNRAILLRNLGRFEASIQASQTAWSIMLQLGQTVEAARALQNLALTYFVLGRYNEALKLLDQARQVFVTDGRERDTLQVDLFISDCLLQMRRFTDVLATCRAARERFAEFEMRFEVAQAILNEAAAYSGQGQYAATLSSLEEARALFEAEGNRVWCASTDLEKAIALLHMGRLEESLALALECAWLFQTQSQPVREAQARLVSARAALGLGRHGHAQELARAVLKAGVDNDIPYLSYHGHYLLGSLAAAAGDREAALCSYDQAIGALERLRGRLMVEFRADFLEDKQGVYEEMVALSLELDRPQQSLEYAERAKSRALLDMLAYRLDLSINVRSEGDAPLVDELTRLRAERNRLYRRWEASEEAHEEGWRPPGEAQQPIVQDLQALEQRITALWHTLLIHNADYARDAALWQVHTEPAQPYLAPGTLLLEYFIARGELMAFLVTSDSLEVRPLPGAMARAQQLLRLLWLNLRSTPRSDLRRAAAMAANVRGLLRQLQALVVAPLADALEPFPQLVVVPHGPLHYLPFHALYDGEAYLLERHEISYLPGASMVRHIGAPRPGTSSRFTFGHSYRGLLPYAVQEAASVAQMLGGVAMLESEATLTRFAEVAGQAQVLHLAAHGDFRPDNPLFSGIALDDGWLTTLELFNLRLGASLVTLSACQTGRNVVAGGDELLGIMRALLYAGAASVVLSLWSVEDRSTAQIMETFYARLAAGAGKGAALRQAQLDYLRDQSGDALCEHPYFWAPFFLVGNTGPL